MEANNNQKMREVLESVAHMNDYGYWNGSAEICNIAAKAWAVLDEPPRNCDVGTTEEQVKRFATFCLFRKCNKCELNNNANFLECSVRWGQMPYEKGGAK